MIVGTLAALRCPVHDGARTHKRTFFFAFF
jgi:hypothetical protein